MRAGGSHVADAPRAAAPSAAASAMHVRLDAQHDLVRWPGYERRA